METIRRILWHIATYLLILSFPIQVYLKSPLPSLFPYFVMLIICFCYLLSGQNKISDILYCRLDKPMDILLFVFIGLVVFQTGWQTLFNYISISDGISAIVIFVLPSIFYVYFRRAGSEKELRSFLAAIAIAGLIVGFYFAYESICKLIFHILPSYAMEAQKYSAMRMGVSLEDLSATRIGLQYRSMGLLEKHTVSCAATSLGCFAALSLCQRTSITTRAFVISLYGFLVIVGLNFTGILAFLVALFVTEFKGYYLLKGTISIIGIQVLLTCLFVSTLIFSITSAFIGFDLVKILYYMSSIQYAVIKGGHFDGGYFGTGYFAEMLSSLISYPVNVMEKFPWGFIIGDGFSRGFGVMKGGDYGFIDTIGRVGLPIFFIILWGFSNMIFRSFWKIRISEKEGNNKSHYLEFSICTIMYLFITEIHYSVWSTKPVLPIVFVCAAIFARYLPSPNRQYLKMKNK